MQIAFVIFDQMTALDFVGVYDPLTRLKSMSFMPDLQWDICSFTPEVRDDRGLHFSPDKIAQPLTDYNLILVPGGYGTRLLQKSSEFIKWLKTAQPAGCIASVCTGALLLGAAGFLKNKAATTHPSAFEELKPYCRKVSGKRVCDEGSVITSRGVTAAIDLGLYLVESIKGPEVREAIAKQMDYPHN